MEKETASSNQSFNIHEMFRKADWKKEILDTFMPSLEMRQYLRTHDLSDQQLLDIIVGSPVPLELKLRYLWGEDKEKTEMALSHLGSDLQGLFLLKEYCIMQVPKWETGEWAEEYTEPSAFGSYDAVQKYLNNRESDCIINNCRWDILLKSYQNSNGKFIHTYGYVLIDNQPCFFFSYQTSSEIDTFRYACSRWLNLPMPFKAGTVLSIDCRPFASPVVGVLLEKEGSTDLEMVYKNLAPGGTKYSKAGLSEVIQQDISELFYTPLISPLYRLKRIGDDSDNREAEFLSYAYQNHRISQKQYEGYFWVTESGLLCRKKAIPGRKTILTRKDPRIDLQNRSYMDEWEEFPEWITRRKGPDFYPHGAVTVQNDLSILILLPQEMSLMDKYLRDVLTAQIELDFGLFNDARIIYEPIES